MSDDSENTPPRAGEPPRSVLAALARILRPLVRLLLTHGVTYPALSRLLKSIYVDVAQTHFTLQDRPLSDSRISLLTGVHRKDVRVLRDASPSRDAAPPAVSLGSQLVARWLTDSRYLRDGQARALPLKASRGPSFETLVATVARRDLKPRVVLDELLRLGVVTMTPEQEVKLKLDAFVPERGFDEKAFFLGRNVADHLSASVHNLDGATPPFLERAVSYHDLTERDVERLRALCEELGMDALRKANRKAMSSKKRSARRTDATQRISFGVYFYSEDSGNASQDEPT